MKDAHKKASRRKTLMEQELKNLKGEKMRMYEENFLNGTRLTAGMVSAFIENVFVHNGGRIVVRFKYEQSIQDTVKALHTG